VTATPGHDDSPDLDERVWPYPKLPPVRNIGQDVPAGRIFAVEGPDGAGKSTQIAMLTERLRGSGWDVAVCAFLRNPLIAQSAPRGKWLNWDPYTMAMTFTAALTDLVNRVVIPHATKPDGVVILDRYVYSIAARAQVRGCPRSWLRSLVEPAALPHATIHLRTPVSECLARKRDSARGFTYWESGVDAFGPDALRMGGTVDEFAPSFTRYQEAVRAVVDDLLAGTDALVVTDPGGPEAVADRVEGYVRERLTAVPSSGTLGQDPAMAPAQRRSRLDTQLIDERAAHALVGRQRVSAPAVGVQRDD
jgi:dTMP kinase